MNQQPPLNDRLNGNIWNLGANANANKAEYERLLDVLQKKYSLSVVKKGNMIFDRMKPPELQIQHVLPKSIHQQRLREVEDDNYTALHTAFGSTLSAPIGTYDRQISPDNNHKVVYQGRVF